MTKRRFHRRILSVLLIVCVLADSCTISAFQTPLLHQASRTTARAPIFTEQAMMLPLANFVRRAYSRAPTQVWKMASILGLTDVVIGAAHATISTKAAFLITSSALVWRWFEFLSPQRTSARPPISNRFYAENIGDGMAHDTGLTETAMFLGRLKHIEELSRTQQVEVLLGVLREPVYDRLGVELQTSALEHAASMRWTEEEYDQYEQRLVRLWHHDHDPRIEQELRLRSSKYLETVTQIPENTVVVIQAGGLGTRLNDAAASASQWIDKNTYKLGGVSQLQRHLNMLAALGYKHVRVIHNDRNAAAIQQDIEGYPTWFDVKPVNKDGTWMENFTEALRDASHKGYKNILMLNGESLVNFEYLARMRFSDSRRVFGFHPYERGFHDVQIADGRILHFESHAQAGSSLLTFVAPVSELLATIEQTRNLEAYISQTFQEPETAAFRLPQTVPDLNTPADLQKRQDYHFFNPEIIGPFPYAQMVHPQRIARAVLASAGLFYGPWDIQDDDLHDCNNRGTVWLTRDRRYVIKAFVGLNDSRYQEGRFTDERYRTEKKFLQSRIPGILTPSLVADEDDIRTLVMTHIGEGLTYTNLAHAISSLDPKDPNGKQRILDWVGQWIEVLGQLQDSPNQPAWSTPYPREIDFNNTESQTDFLSRQGYDMQDWAHALPLFREHYSAHPSPEVPAQGDYAPLNFILHENGSALIDGEFSGRAPREKDLATALVRMHQMNMRTAYITPNSHLHAHFEEILTHMIEAYEQASGYPIHWPTLYFFMAQDFMQRAYDQILFKNDTLSPRLYLELSRRYLDSMVASIREPNHPAPFGKVASDIFNQSVSYADLVDHMRWGRIDAALELIRNDSSGYLSDALCRLTADREPVVRQNAFQTFSRLGLHFYGAYDLPHDYRYLGYRALAAGHLETATTLFRYAQGLHHQGEYVYRPYEEKLNAVLAITRQATYWLDHGIRKKPQRPGQRILVFGGSGFLGKRVISRLLSQVPPHAQIVVADQQKPDLSVWDPTISEAVRQGRIQFEQIEGRDPIAVESLFDRYGGFDQAVNLAAMKLPMWSRWHPAGAVESNVLLGLYWACAQYGTRLIQISTADFYPGKAEGSYSEEDLIDPTRNPYSASKMILETMPQLLGIPAVALRASNLYGAGQGNGLVSAFTAALLLGKDSLQYFGNIWLDFLHVSDAARAVVEFTRHPSLIGIFNVSTHAGTHLFVAAQSIRQILIEVAGEDIPEERLGRWPEGQPNVRVLDNTRLRESTGFQFLYSTLEQGLPEMMKEEVADIRRRAAQPEPIAIPERSIKDAKEKFLSTYRTNASTFLPENGLEGTVIENFQIGPVLPGEAGRIRSARFSSGQVVYVTAGPTVVGHRIFIQQGREIVLTNQGYLEQRNLTLWSPLAKDPKLHTAALVDPVQSIYSGKAYRHIGPWIYLADTPRGELANIPPIDGYWVHSESRALLNNEQMAYLLIKNQLEEFGRSPSTDIWKYPNEMQIKEINTRAFLIEHGYRTFEDIPDDYLMSQAQMGINTLWMMGAWEESRYSREFQAQWDPEGQEGRVASAYAVPRYQINPSLGGEAAFRSFVLRAKQYGLRIALDIIPNHLAVDSPLIDLHPEMFIYRLDPHRPGEKACFEHVLPNNTPIYVAYGREDYSWKDTAQLNLLEPQTWRFLKEAIFHAAELTRGGAVRLDSLNTIDSEAYRQRWFPQMSREEFDDRMRRISLQVFGRAPQKGGHVMEVLLDEVKTAYPDLKIIGEVVKAQHGQWQRMGVDLTSALYIYYWLIHGADGGFTNFKDYIFHRGSHSEVEPGYYYHSFYYLEDHDLRIRLLEVLRQKMGKSEIDSEVIARSKLFVTAIATIPGVPLIYEGQETGKFKTISSANRIPKDPYESSEPWAGDLSVFYQNLFATTAQPVFRQGGLPQEVPLKGGDLPEIMVFKRYFENQEALVALNDSSKAITVTLDFSRFDLNERTLTLPPYGTHVEITERSHRASGTMFWLKDLISSEMSDEVWQHRVAWWIEFIPAALMGIPMALFGAPTFSGHPADLSNMAVGVALAFVGEHLIDWIIKGFAALFGRVSLRPWEQFFGNFGMAIVVVAIPTAALLFIHASFWISVTIFGVLWLGWHALINNRDREFATAA